MDDEFRAFRRAHLGRALARARWAFEAQFDARIIARGFQDYRGSDIEIIARIPAPESTTVASLAERARTSKQAISKLVGGLEQRGYVRREPDAEDRRAQRIFLTKSGERFLLAAREVIEEIETAWADVLSPTRLERVKKELLKAATAFDGDDYL